MMQSMKNNTARFLTMALIVSPLACYADASYEHTTQVTGGQFIDALKNVAFISKQIRALTEPNSEITMVHGNQKAVVSKDYTEITDLDKQVIIHIDNNKKTYTVRTFADMRTMIQQLPQEMEQMQQQLKDQQAKAAAQQAKAQQAQAQQLPPNLQFNFTTSVTDPGVAKVVNGQNTKEQILTLKMTVTDSNNPATNVAYTMTTDIYTTPDVPAEMKEVRDFDMRFGQKLMEGLNVDPKEMMATWAGMRNGSSAAMAQMFGGKPGAADAFAQMQKEMAKITGTRIMEIQRMGGTGTGIQAQSATPGGTPSGTSVAGQVAGDTATQTAAGESSKLGIPGAALGSALSSVWNKKKAKPAPAPAPATTTATAEVTLMEMTTQTHNFSTEAIPMSVFQIPSGYKQVQSPTMPTTSK